MIILPRQARDKHRKSCEKGGVFLQALVCSKPWTMPTRLKGAGF